jgi:putative exosortase-associated protein (TIGR04073 family)
MRSIARQGTALMACVAVVVLAGGSAAAAEEAAARVCPVCSKTAAGDGASYSAKAGCTLVRGASNTLLGWTELLRQPAQEAKGGGNVLVGIGKGVGQGVVRTLAGVGELLTFWLPRSPKLAADCPLCMGKSAQ